jgi:cell division protein ZapA
MISNPACANPRELRQHAQSPLADFYANFPFSRRVSAHTMPSPTRVQIFGQTYSIAGDLDPAYVQKLAAYVDEKMRTISDATSTVDTQKAAVLAALAIADELHSGQRERSEQEELLREQAERCLTLVERALKQTA